MTLASVVPGYTNSEVVGYLALALLFALLGYRMSHRHRVVRGVTPWRVPSLVWAAVCFFLQPFGLVVELVAQATTKPALRRVAGQVAGAPRALRPTSPPAVELAPAGAPLPGVTGPPPPEGDGSGRTPLFGWYPDVTGRHDERYFDGRRWSEFVRDGGSRSTDPL